MHSALDYVLLAEAKHGAIPRGQALDYVWGDAAASLAAYPPDAGIVNLETSVTDCSEAEPKGINYRMSPRNAEAIGSLGVDCCVLHRHTPSLLNVCPCLVIMAKENEGLLDELNAFALLSE